MINAKHIAIKLIAFGHNEYGSPTFSSYTG